MNSDEIWLLQLWSGTFAAAVSGAVAVFVLYLSNRHQTKLSKLAREDASAAADRQLESQAVGLREQLVSQQRGLEAQLVQQRLEATKERQAAALADLLVSQNKLVRAMMWANPDTELSELFGDMQTKAARWQMELPEAPERHDILRFVMMLQALAERTAIEKEAVERQKRLTSFLEASNVLRDVILAWITSTKDEQLLLLAGLNRTREKLDRPDMFKGY